MARHLIILATLLVLAFPVGALSQDAGAEEAPSYPPAQHFTLEPDIFMYAGYRFVGVRDFKRAGEYDYLHPSFTGGLRIHDYPLPFMIDLDFDYLNEEDHDGTFRFGYSDVVRLDIRSTELFHNMDHYRMFSTSTLPAPFDRDVNRDPNRFYGVTVNDNDIFLQLKWPGKPYHVYADVREFRKDGTIQQRWQPSLFNTGRISQPRDIDWVTREYTAGISGNVLGLFEVDYHHIAKTFDSKLQGFLVDTYNIPALTLSHNLVPDTETHLNSVSAHSDQDRMLTAAAGVNWGEKENEFSRSYVQFDREYGEVAFSPGDWVLFAVRYGHQDLQVKNPERVPAVPFPTVPARPEVDHRSISTERDKGVAALRIMPADNVTVLAQYELEAVDRTNVEMWTHPMSLIVSKGDSITHKGKLNVSLSPARHTKVRAGFTYSRNGDPSYNLDFKNSYEGYAWGTVTPMPGLTANAQCRIFRGDNPVESPLTDAEPVNRLDRDVARDTVGAGVTWFAMKGLVLGAHYDWLRSKVRSNLIYQDGAGTNIYAFDTPYRDASHSYTVFANYCFSFPLELEASFGQNWSKGLYRLTETFMDADGNPTALTLTPGGLLDTLTDQKIRETSGSIKADYEIYRGWGTTLAYAVSQFSDLSERRVTGPRDSTVHAGTVLLTKKW